MEIFDNREYSNYEQIVEMGPSWLTDFREMDANYQYAGWTLDLAAYFLEMLINNEFPEHCDEATLAKFERILRIEYDNEMSLEERRRTVSAFWAGNGKLNKTAIEGIVKSYTGQDAAISWSDQTLVIDFDNTETAVVAMSMLQRILERRMPAHIDYQIRCMAVAYVGVSASTDCQKVVFPITGTYPKLSKGVSLNNDSIASGVSGQGYLVHYPLCGEDGLMA